MKNHSTSWPRCGLCGKTQNLTKTPCCGNWICNDGHKYVLFSFARNSCARNHMHFTLCGFHHNEGHHGNWKECAVCRESFQTEMYVWYGTNEYNFERLEKPPQYEPTYCAACGTVIKLASDAYSIRPEGIFCEKCSNSKPRTMPVPGKTKNRTKRVSKRQLPANANPEALEIILSNAAQKRWRIAPTIAASEPAAHWLAQWRMDFGLRADRTQVALVTNIATLYTFVFTMKELGRGANFEKVFRARLSFALQGTPSLMNWQRAPLLFATGNPRMVIGSMNDMRHHISWKPIEHPRSDEDMLNGTPFLSLEGFFPEEAFSRKLAEANSASS